jgi:hypothetical protein
MFASRIVAAVTDMGQFSTPRTLEFEGCGPDQQFRIDVTDPSAPIDAMSGRGVLATVFRS